MVNVSLHPADTSDRRIMATDLFVWLLFPAVIGTGTAALVWMLMNARIEVLKCQCRAAVAELERGAGLRGAALESAVHEARETARREAFEQLISRIRIEQRRFIRRRALFGGKGR